METAPVYRTLFSLKWELQVMDKVPNNSCVYCDISSLETCRLKRLERVHSIMQYTQITIFFEVY
jgi:hypothetical protein